MKKRTAADNASSPLELRRQDISRCVKCGACRAVCPSFLREREESLSARGRMAIIKAVLEKRIPASGIYRDRLTACTGCLACEAACPNGVRVTGIIQAAKEQAIIETGAGIIAGAVAEVIRNPLLFRAAAWIGPVALHYKHRGPGNGGGRKKNAPSGAMTRSGQRVKGSVAFFPGCAIRYWQQDIGKSVTAVLNRLGYEVLLPEGMKCCGRPLFSLGDREGAEELIAHNAAVLAGLPVDAVVTACASCGLTFKREYSTVVNSGRGGLRVLDIHEFLSSAVSGAALAPVRKTVTWHDPCHLGRGQGVSRTAREILRSIPGLTLVEMKNADRCCGFGGTMRITRSGLSNGIADEKAKDIRTTGASLVATGCPACRMQITDALERAGSDVAVVHTLQVLEEALSGV